MKTKVWTASIIIFHWSLAVGFAAAFILGKFEGSKNFHFAFGLFAGTLIFFRILYGFFGPKYANFKDFPISIKKQIGFVKNFFKADIIYTGHNPGASVVMLLIFVIGLFCSVSGYLLYSTEGAGLFTVNINKEILEESHEILANLFLIFVLLHLAGLLADLIFHSKLKAIQSIFTGYKNIDGESTNQNAFQKVYTIFWIIIPLIILYYGYNLEVNTKKSGEKKTEHRHEENDDD